jgi:hypothetical protein
MPSPAWLWRLRFGLLRSRQPVLNVLVRLVEQALHANRLANNPREAVVGQVGARQHVRRDTMRGQCRCEVLKLCSALVGRNLCERLRRVCQCVGRFRQVASRAACPSSRRQPSSCRPSPDRASRGVPRPASDRLAGRKPPPCQSGLSPRACGPPSDLVALGAEQAGQRPAGLQGAAPPGWQWEQAPPLAKRGAGCDPGVPALISACTGSE